MTPRRPTTPATALFAVPDRSKGATERAIEKDLAGWRAAGRHIDAVISKALRAQAHAVDIAEAKADPWQVGNANRVLLELMRGFGLVDTTNTSDPFAAMLDKLGRLGDEHTDNDPAAGADTAVPDTA